MPKHRHFLVHFDAKVKIKDSKKSIILRVTKRRERQSSADKLAIRMKPSVVQEVRDGRIVSTLEVR